jgi:hypothetical protein
MMNTREATLLYVIDLLVREVDVYKADYDLATCRTMAIDRSMTALRVEAQKMADENAQLRKRIEVLVAELSKRDGLELPGSVR